MSVNGKKLTPEEIVDGLHSDDADVRNRAMDALFPADSRSGGAVLIRSLPERTEPSTTNHIDAGRMFTAMLQMTTRLGAALGMQLAWVQDPSLAEGKIVRVSDMPNFRRG